MNPESQFAEQLHAAYPPPEENPDLTRAVLALRVQPRPSRARNALLMTAAAAAVVLVVAVALPRRDPQASTSPTVTPVSSANAPAHVSPSSAAAAVPSVAALADRTWHIPGSRATFFLHGTSVQTQSGCQSGQATADVAGDTMTLSDLDVSSGGVCVGGPPTVDAALLADRGDDHLRWSISDGRLTITAVDTGRTLTYIDAGPGRVDVSVAANSAEAIAQLAESSWLLPGNTYRLTFAGGRAKGQVWTCGTLDGPATISSTTITVQGSGPVRCTTPNSPMSGQQSLRWHLDGDLLLLTDGDGLTSQWIREAPVSTSTEAPSSPSATTEPVALLDHTWQIPGSRATFYLHGSQLLLSNGCQSGRATATTSGDTITITDQALSAGPACTPDAPVIDAAFLETGTDTAQSDSVRWAISGDRLTLTVLSNGASLTYIDAGPGQVEPTIGASTAADVVSLENSSWTLPGTARGELTLAAGKITASAPGCDVRIGRATISESEITIAETDWAGCPMITGTPSGFDFGRDPLRWHLQDGLLLLTDGSGQAMQWVSVPATVPGDLANRSWQVPGSVAGISFGVDTVSMATGCSGMDAKVVVTADELQLGSDAWSSSQGCPTATHPVVRQGIFLTPTLRWKLSDDRLTVTDPHGHALTYVDAGPGHQTLPIPTNTAAGEQALATSTWVLPGTAGKLTIADGRIDGSIGVCNAIHGPGVITSTTMTVTHDDGPPVPCPQSAAQTGDFGLTNPLRWHLEGDLLLLTNAKNEASQWVPAG